MAAAALPAPGTQYGPCEGDCDHRDCAATRRMASAKCRICGEPIGYERRFFIEDGASVHEVCLYEEIERAK